MLDNIVQGIRYFVQFCLAFYRHNYVILTSCSSFVKILTDILRNGIYLLILSFRSIENFLYLYILCQHLAHRLLL